MNIWVIFYLYYALLNFAIARLFIQSHDGFERALYIVYFITIGLGSLFIAISRILKYTNIHVFNDDFSKTIIIIPIILTTSILAFYLYKKYDKFFK